MSKNNPIGVFDSGVGGLTVAQAVNKLMPHEDIAYFGDTAHLPYGDKSSEAIIEYSLGIAKHLVEERKVKAILIACNSASAVAFDVLQKEYKNVIPVFNVIDPVADKLAHQESSKIGIIGTRATIASKTYTNKIKGLAPSKDVKTLATPLLVPVIEEGLASNVISESIISYYLSNQQLEDIDLLVLGCTHYPLIQRQVEQMAKNRFKVVDSPSIVSEKVEEELSQLGLLNDKKELGELIFEVSDYTQVFDDIANIMFSQKVGLSENNIWKK